MSRRDINEELIEALNLEPDKAYWCSTREGKLYVSMVLPESEHILALKKAFDSGYAWASEFPPSQEADLVAGEAYQVIGDLALAANLYDHPEVQRALDWFSGFEPSVTYKDDASILPWPKEELKADDYSALTARIEALEEENEELHDSLEAAFLGSPGWRDKARQALAKKEG